MILIPSAETHDEMLGAFQRRLEGAELRIYDQARPTSPNAPIDGQKLLATVPFTGAELADGMVRGSFDQELAGASGEATWARAIASDGSPIFDCDVGEKDSDAAIELNTTGLRKGGPVSINSFALGVSR